MDDSMKLWDIRMTAKPVLLWDDLPNLSSKTNIALSPDQKIIVTGSSVRKNYGNGTLHGFCTTTGRRVCEVPVGPSSVISTFWHGTLNQIFVGMADGKIEVLYNPILSKGGILKCISK